MSRRPTQRRHSSWERITIHPRRDRKKIDALKGDMVRAYMKGDLETYWKLDRELRWILTQGKSGRSCLRWPPPRDGPIIRVAGLACLYHPARPVPPRLGQRCRAETVGRSSQPWGG